MHDSHFRHDLRSIGHEGKYLNWTLTISFVGIRCNCFSHQSHSFLFVSLSLQLISYFFHFSLPFLCFSFFYCSSSLIFSVSHHQRGHHLRDPVCHFENRWKQKQVNKEKCPQSNKVQSPSRWGFVWRSPPARQWRVYYLVMSNLSPWA